MSLFGIYTQKICGFRFDQEIIVFILDCLDKTDHQPVVPRFGHEPLLLFCFRFFFAKSPINCVVSSEEQKWFVRFTWWTWIFLHVDLLIFNPRFLAIRIDALTLLLIMRMDTSIHWWFPRPYTERWLSPSPGLIDRTPRIVPRALHCAHSLQKVPGNCSGGVRWGSRGSRGPRSYIPSPKLSGFMWGQKIGYFGWELGFGQNASSSSCFQTGLDAFWVVVKSHHHQAEIWVSVWFFRVHSLGYLDRKS